MHHTCNQTQPAGHTCAADDLSEVVLSELISYPERDVLVHRWELGEWLELGGDVTVYKLLQETLV